MWFDSVCATIIYSLLISCVHIKLFKLGIFVFLFTHTMFYTSGGLSRSQTYTNMLLQVLNCCLPERIKNVQMNFNRTF